MRNRSSKSYVFGLVIGSLLWFSGPAGAAETVYFGAITLYHPIIMYEKYQPLMEYLSKNTPYKFELKLSQNYQDIIHFIKTNQVQVALLGGVTYLGAKKEFEVVPILKPLSEGRKPFYRCVIITSSANDAIRTLSDLKGRSFAFASKSSTSGYLAPRHHLYKNDIRLEDFSRHQNLRYHDEVAREVLKGNFDAGAVIDSVADRFKERGLKVLAVTDPIPGLPIVVRADAAPLLIDSITKALLALNYDYPEHRAIMAQWDEELRFGFIRATDSDYDVIRNMTIECNNCDTLSEKNPAK